MEHETVNAVAYATCLAVGSLSMILWLTIAHMQGLFKIVVIRR